MKIKELKPKKALNKAFLKVKPNRTDIERFKTNLIQLLDRTNDTESEEFHKNLVSDFLKKTYYDPTYFINTKGRKDLVIHNGNNAASAVGVVIEAKKPTNKAEMVTTEKLNAKAFHELMLYYLEERITHKNLELKHLVITNINEWFIFDATLFERLFAENKTLVKQFNDFQGQRLSGVKTDFFYKQIAEPFLQNLTQEIEFTYFDIRDYNNPLRNSNKSDDNKLIALFKLLSPEHLLKLPFANDSNSLDKRFYTELLHIIGLSETKEGSKKLIGRNKEGGRNFGSILEDAIIQLDSLDKISRLDNPNHFGATNEERLFNVALELSITWINRILFLKLLEAQLISYHKDDESFSFLNFNKIKNFDDLNSLFFQVLARKFDERNADVKQAFHQVPYLNSSLFEPTEIEQQTIFISNLKDDKTLPVLLSTVLKNEQGKKRTGNLTTLQYLFEFLNAYDFSSEGSEEIQEDNKTLINASVLGLIFEKINGYKEGSFFTPGFITMYMCHETIGKAVIQKFSEYCLNHDLQDVRIERMEDIYDLIPKHISRKKANEIINNIKICDPAVGSGHFLVSALNEMIAVKSYLKILEDKSGKSLNRYEIQVVNDELIITDEDGDFFEYHPNNAESQRVQEALFHEKQTIIENCLFGVDINPNSVKICRLRLWIELLKNAYYKNATELETLPNIDINIKCGNSLVSRFAIDADLSKALKESKWTIDSYRIAVNTYRNAENKEQKREMERMIRDIKNDFRKDIQLRDPKIKELQKLRGQLFELTQVKELFDENNKKTKDWKKKVEDLSNAINKKEAEIEEIKNNRIYENAFEWRFEFPEVLDDEGKFVGFDVVIGNPPYGIGFTDKMKEFLNTNFQGVQQKMFDSFLFFISLAERLVRLQGIISLIVPNNLIYQMTFEKARLFLISHFELTTVINLGDKVFEDADVPTCIYVAKKNNVIEYSFNYKDLRDDKSKEQFISLNLDESERINKSTLLNTYSLVFGVNENHSRVINKINNQSSKIAEVVENASYGIGSGGDKIFRLNRKFCYDSNFELNILFPVYSGGNINRYFIDYQDEVILYTTKDLIIDEYPNVLNYLKPFKNKLSQKRETIKGILPWWSLHWPRNKQLYTGDKIVLRQTGDKIVGAIDTNSYYVMDSVMVIKFNNETKLSLEYALALLNSKLYSFLYENISKEKGRTFAQVKPQNIKQLPIKCISINDQMPLINLVKQIQSSKELNKSADTRALEHQIDQLVYQLYDLTEEEIAIVENGSK